MELKIEHVFFDHSHTKWNMALAPTRYHILLLVVKGTVDYRLGDANVTLGKGDGLFIPQGTLRSRSVHTDASEPQQMYSVHFRDSSPEYLVHFMDEPYKRIRPFGYDYLKQRFSMLSECWLGKMPCYEMISQGIALEILGLIQSELVAEGIPSSKRNLAARIQQYIVKHYRDPIRLQELAAYVDRSPNYISSVFKEVTGRTPVEYMHEVRITSAREMLLTTNMTIGEIADALGYCDQTYFNYMYKKIVGQPPSHLKKGKIV
ncbi:AraC family transcriptional regulator [Paenibacillus allorhizosphaerae]|uniref:HTH-type transcriptional activator RhaS n=1 Tax=Paenibacillus allorhizosphaerae TaxID=2849866 RepID=A0ABN7TL08_9BACL|nr:AraC family transcriptional regulator [Paenibacillus allorhizosphaerae]CAG7644838.1 HTH-type transcriptional activator RhaS [Paenibacillus allorhizosphaerae]